jgi:hypothetical protein
MVQVLERSWIQSQVLQKKAKPNQKPQKTKNPANFGINTSSCLEQNL